MPTNDSGNHMTVKNLLAVSMVLVLCSCAQEDAAAPAELSAAAAPVVADPAEVAARVAAADAAMGKRQYIYCQSCHTVNAGGQNKVGPNLSGVIDRAAGQAEGFVYSDALSNTELVWDLATLDAWIENPRKLAPGTTMIFGGVKDPAQRANLLAYLQQVTQP
jgi:cytochrome c